MSALPYPVTTPIERLTSLPNMAANDFTGQWSEAISPGITVDVTPPIINQIWLEGIVANWEPVEERESEVASVELGLGSRPGSSDLLQWTGAGTGGVLGRSLNGSGLQDGQLVFLSLAVSLYLYHGEMAVVLQPHIRKQCVLFEVHNSVYWVVSVTPNSSLHNCHQLVFLSKISFQLFCPRFRMELDSLQCPHH